ncbi:MAG: hypothetical protein ACKOAU_10050 [Pirellula sp.]
MMRWRRWLFLVIVLLVLVGVYSQRRSIIASLLSSRFSSRIDSQSLDTSVEGLEMQDASIELDDGRSVSIDKVQIGMDMKGLLRGDLVIDSLELQRVRIPMELPASTLPALPTLPDEFGSVPDVGAWIDPWLEELVAGIDRDADRVLIATQELESRADQLRADLERSITSDPSSLNDRKRAALISREYHQIKQRLAELRIQARSIGKDHLVKWSRIQASMSERFENRMHGMLPDADRQIQQLAKTYSQRVTPTVLTYCDIVAAAMHPRGSLASKSTSSRTTLIRKASLFGELVDSQGSDLKVPFECEGCQWAWDSPMNYPTTSVWYFDLPADQGRLEIHAESSQQDLLQMTCYWYISSADQPFQANPNRIRIDVQQSDQERLISLSAPWDPRQKAPATQPLGRTHLTLSFRQTIQKLERTSARTIPVAWESVAVEPRILFELENALEESKQHWVKEVQNRWNQVASERITARQERSAELWQSLSTQTMETLLSLDKRLCDWQQRWDSSTSLEQYRVGNRLTSHPDAYSIPSKQATAAK